MKSKAQRPMVLAAIQVLFHLGSLDRRLAGVLLHHYVEGDEEVKTLVMDYLLKHGMVDPGGYFQSAMRGIEKKHSSLSVVSDNFEMDGGGNEDDEEEGVIPGSTELASLVHDWLGSWTEELAWVTHSRSAASKQPKKSVNHNYL